MSNNYAVQVSNLSKKYKIYDKPYHRLVEWLTFNRLRKHNDYWALKNINFTLESGKCLGVIGANGAGKSTLLKILSKSLIQSDGNIEINGNVVSLLELGTGFHPEMTGIENIYNSGRILGYSDEFLDSIISEVVEFSELGDYVNKPIKTYSSGMYVRLAFSFFANLNPDIYIVDEALSVGDIFFQQKCFKFLEELKRNGASIIIVTHDMQTVLKYCDEVSILKNGEIIKSGKPVEMVNYFYSMDNNGLHQVPLDTIDKNDIEEVEVPILASKNAQNASGLRRGNGKVEIVGAELCNAMGESVGNVTTGELVYLNIYVKAYTNIDNLTIGYQITDRFNTIIFGQNTYMITEKSLNMKENEITKVTFEITMNLFQGLYTFAIAATDCTTEKANIIYDLVEGCLLLEVLRPERRLFHGVAYIDSRLNLNNK